MDAQKPAIHSSDVYKDETYEKNRIKRNMNICSSSFSIGKQKKRIFGIFLDVVPEMGRHEHPLLWCHREDLLKPTNLRVHHLIHIQCALIWMMMLMPTTALNLLIQPNVCTKRETLLQWRVDVGERRRRELCKRELMPMFFLSVGACITLWCLRSACVHCLPAHTQLRFDGLGYCSSSFNFIAARVDTYFFAPFLLPVRVLTVRSINNSTQCAIFVCLFRLCLHRCLSFVRILSPGLGCDRLIWTD